MGKPKKPPPVFNIEALEEYLEKPASDGSYEGREIVPQLTPEARGKLEMISLAITGTVVVGGGIAGYFIGKIFGYPELCSGVGLLGPALVYSLFRIARKGDEPLYADNEPHEDIIP